MCGVYSCINRDPVSSITKILAFKNADFGRIS